MENIKMTASWEDGSGRMRKGEGIKKYKWMGTK